MKQYNILFGMSVVLFLLMTSVSAVPHLINFEGKLSDPEGNHWQVIM